VKITLVCAWLSLAALPAAAQGTGAAVKTPATAEKPAAQTPAANAGGAATPIDPAKEAVIRKLFEVQGTAKLMQQVMGNMTTNMKPMLMTSLPQGEYREKLINLFFQRFQEKLNAEQLINLMVPVYDKYLSKEEIEKLIEFYKTPIGQKLISVQPQILAETQAASMKMGQDIGRQSMVEVLDENPDLKKALENAAVAPQN
jgi:hypothetical protein